MRTPLQPLVLAAIVSGAAALAQDGPKPLPSDLAELAAKVDAAHHPEGKPGEVTRFEAALSLEPLATTQQQSAQVDLTVRYLRWQPANSKKVKHLVRYTVHGTDRDLQRGRDRFGFWQLVDGEARDITRADTEDRKAVQRDTALARQLLRFLDPGAVMRSLTNPAPVREQPFKVGRKPAIDCFVAEGSLASFPLLRLEGDGHPVRLQLFVQKSDGRLIAVIATPERSGRTVPATAEMVRLSDYRLQNGVLIPKQLLSSFRNDQGKMKAQSRVKLTAVDLAPEFVVDDLGRPKPKTGGAKDGNK
ncbi:MAG: hypothetical protein NXI31_00420 [bacterium]|nr:hypothetical protein [bacterium]